MTPADEARAAYWRKQQLASVTFGIELRGISIMLSYDWERLAARIDRYELTGDPELDVFWRDHFSPMTTKWIHAHPRLKQVGKTFDRYRLVMADAFDFARPKYAHLVMKAC